MNQLPSDVADIDRFYYTAKHYHHHMIEIGEHTYGLPRLSINRGGAKIKIGKFCSLSPAAEFTIHAEHRTDWISTYPFVMLKSVWPEAARVRKDDSIPFRGDIELGNDVWIGSGAVILGGAKIGDGAIIGAHAVVAGEIPPYAIAFGNPAKVHRMRFSDAEIAILQKVQWWDWPLEKIQANAHVLVSDDFARLLDL